jgi:tartrate dehydrogenase/decarboxylase / D-malate dehydrogenase
MPYRIALYPGDGIGKEVVLEARKALESTGADFQFTEFNWNSSLYLKTGKCAPPDFLDRLKPFDAVLLGALGDASKAPDHISIEPLLEIRRGFDLYANLRPAVLYPGVDCPLKNRSAFDIDMVIIRENTEGEYTTLGGRHYIGTPYEAAMQVNYFSRMGIERIIRYGFETASGRKRKRLTSVTKSNALKHSMVMWDEIFREMSHEYPAIECDSMLVDAAAMNLVRKPDMFDVIVTTNLFGDILSDISAIIVGGMGFAGSGNINPERKFPSMFEPVHGSAPDIAGKGAASPVAAILSAAMMMDFLGESTRAHSIRNAIQSHLAEGRIKTPDRGGKNTTAEVGADIVERIKNSQ